MRWIVSSVTACLLLASSLAAAQTNPSSPSADANATYILSLPGHQERPAHRISLAIGGSYPAAMTLQTHATLGVAPLSAARLTVGGLWHVRQTNDGVKHHIQPLVLIGPTAIFDMVRYVPHVFVQGGVALVPLAPVIAFGASLEQFFSLRTSAIATLQGVWQHGFGLRVEAQMGISFSGL